MRPACQAHAVRPAPLLLDLSAGVLIGPGSHLQYRLRCGSTRHPDWEDGRPCRPRTACELAAEPQPPSRGLIVQSSTLPFSRVALPVGQLNQPAKATSPSALALVATRQASRKGRGTAHSPQLLLLAQGLVRPRPSSVSECSQCLVVEMGGCRLCPHGQGCSSRLRHPGKSLGEKTCAPLPPPLTERDFFLCRSAGGSFSGLPQLVVAPDLSLFPLFSRYCRVGTQVALGTAPVESKSASCRDRLDSSTLHTYIRDTIVSVFASQDCV